MLQQWYFNGKMLFYPHGQGYNPTFGLTVGFYPYRGVRVNPKETPQQTKTPNRTRCVLVVGCGVTFGLTRTPWSGWDPMVGVYRTLT